MRRPKTEPSPKRRWRAARWLVRIFTAGVVLLVVLLGGVLALAHSLDRAWVRQRVRAFVLASNGLDVDYGSVELGLWSTLDVRDLVVRSPGAVRSVAPELLRVRHLSAHWSPATLLAPGLNLRDVNVEGVTFTVALDERGKSSIDYIPLGPSTPPSQLARDHLGVGWPIRKLSARDVTLALVRSDRGKAIERDTLRGFALEADAEAISGGTRLRIAMGTEKSPLTLALAQQRDATEPRTATAHASLALQATPSEAHALLRVQVLEQALAPHVSTDAPLLIELATKFDVPASRTLVSLTRCELGSAATAEGVFELRDHGTPVVKHARADLDLGALLRMVPDWATPVQFQRGHAKVVVDDFAPVSPSSNAAITAQVELSEVRVPLTGGGEIDGEHVALDVDVQRGASGLLSGKTQLEFSNLYAKGRTPIAVREGSATLRLRDFRIDTDAPLSSRGELWLETTLVSIESQTSLRTNGSLHFRAHTLLSGSAPFGLDAGLSSDRVQVVRLDGQPLLDTPLHASLTVKDLTANLEQPSKSDANAHLTVEAGPHSLAVDATKHGEVLSYELTVRAPQLAAAMPFLSPEVAQWVPWNKTALELHSRGTLEHLNAREPELHESSRVQLTGAGYKALSTRTLALELQSDGTTNHQKAHAVLRVAALTANGTVLGDDQLTLSLSFDRARQSLDLALDNDRIVKAELTASVAFDRGQRALAYHLTGNISHFAAVLPQPQALTGLDLSTLELGLRADGSMTGVFTSKPNAELAMAPDALSNARGTCTLALSANGVSWANGDRAFRAPTATLHAAINVRPGHRTVESDLTADAFEIALGRRHLDITGFHDRTSLNIDGLLGDVSFDLAQQASVATLKQNFASLYPVGNASLTVHARRAPDGLIEISDLRLENRAGGTALTASGGVDLSDDQRRLTLRMSVQQDLGLVSSRRDVFSGSGQASLDLAVQSPDFRVFHNQATLRLDNANAHFARSEVLLDAVDGEVPILLDLTLSPQGVELLRGVQVNPYATLRFADQHPLLSTRSFLSIGKVTTPVLAIAPFAANLKIEQNIVSLSQLELGVRGGSVTGDGVFDWNGAQSTLQADVHASGVQSSHGEPFDGNAALVVDLGDRSIEGRADILRIGRRHLLDLLDLEDPHRANPAMNRVRSALGYGYPERVRITFKHGFASAGVTFGGLASLVSVDDVRGIPVGPLMERAVSSFGTEQEP